MRSLSPHASSSRSSDVQQDLEEHDQYRDGDGSASSPQAQRLVDGRWKCSHCDKTFTRRGHLKRHEENHLPAKRYQCQFCLKSFARNDVLVRHRAVHQQGARPSDNSRSEAALKRARTACRQCSAIKMKCDGNLPCERCRAKPDGGLQCTYRSSTRLSSADSPQQDQSDDPYRPDHHQQQYPQQHQHQVQQQYHQLHQYDGRGHMQDHLPFDQQYQPSSNAHTGSRSGVADGMYGRSNAILCEFEASAASSLAGLSDPFFLHQHQQHAQQLQHPQQQQQQHGQQQHTHHQNNHAQGGQPSMLQAGLPQSMPASSSQGPPFDMPSEPVASLLESPDFESYCGNGIFDWLFAAEQAGLPWQPSESGQAGANLHQEVHADGPTGAFDMSLPGNSGGSASFRRPPASSNRHSPASAGTTHQWPNGHSLPSDRNGIVPVMLPEPSPNTIALENTYQVSALDDAAKARLLELPHMADLPADQIAGAETCLAATPSQTLNVFVQLYFEHFDRICPILHRATFEPSRCHVLLLGAMCAVGAMHSSIPHANEFAQMLMTVVNRAIFACLPNDSGLMRNVGYMQALLLNFNFFRSSGNQRMLELAESARSPLTTMTRKSRLFDRPHNRSPPSSTSLDRGDDTLSSSWLEWVEEETGRRTAWYYFISDMELSAVWKLPPSFALDELKTELPQDDMSWQAPSATAWAARSDHRATSVYLTQLHDALRSGAVHDITRRLDSLRASSTQQTILSYSLCSLGMSLWSLEFSCLSGIVAQGLEEFAHISSGFLESMAPSGGSASARPTGLPWADSSAQLPDAHTTPTAEVLLRFVLLRNCIDIADIQLLAGRSGRRDDMQRSFRHLRSHFLQHPHKLWPALVHSGRILRLCTRAKVDSMYDGCFLFYAATALFVCAKVWPDVYGHPGPEGNGNGNLPHVQQVPATAMHMQGRQQQGQGQGQGQAQQFPQHAATPICLDAEHPVSLDEPQGLLSARFTRAHKAQLPPRGQIHHNANPTPSKNTQTISHSQMHTQTQIHSQAHILPPTASGPSPTPTPTLNSLSSMDITRPGAPAQVLRHFSDQLLSRPATTTRAWPIGQLLGRIMGEMAGVVGV